MNVPSDECTDPVIDEHHCSLCHRPLVNSPTVIELEKQIASQAAEMEQLRKELAESKAAFERLEKDMHALNRKYVAEIEHVANVQHEKDLVEHELEELSCRLFEEANGMVAIEKREKWQLERQLSLAQEHLAAEKSQLQELRERLQSVTQHALDPYTARARLDLQELHGAKRASTNHFGMSHNPRVNSLAQENQRATSMPPLPSQQQQKPPQAMSIDEFQLAVFREFLRLSPTTPLKKMNQFAYVKHCLVEDVEPCLRFGPHSRLSVKKMMTYLSRQPCFIEQFDPENSKHLTVQTTTTTAAANRPLWERFSQTHNPPPSTLSCAACARVAEPDRSWLRYRFRLDETEEWSLIDQYCRDRLVAVCEFYVFLRNIQKGLYAERSVDDLYAENIRLRLQMFYSRMGALPMVLDDLGLDPDVIGKASPPLEHSTLDDAYLSDGAMSTGPQTPIQVHA